jgi:Ca2+-transporting ATPase
MEVKTQWHALQADQMVRQVQTDLSAGLAASEAARRLERYGRNVLPEGERRTLLRMFLDQFKDILVLILVAACAVSFMMGEFTDALVILAILLLNGVMGVMQEHKANRAMEALKKMSVPVCEAIRDGKTVEVSSEELVPGDLVILREGNAVPADLRLTECYNLQIDEASLTGESAPVEKALDAQPASTPLAERANMAYAGTHATYGRGRGIVVATGMGREIGQIAALLQQGEATVTPLQRNLAGLGKLLGIITLATCAVVFVAGFLWAYLRPEHKPTIEVFKEMFLVAVSLAVAAIPEGLPAITTIVLALGVYRMSRRNAIVRKLPAVETLGCATYICTDKTGTLTQNRMTVTRAATMNELLEGQGPVKSPQRDDLLRVAALCNDAHIEPDGRRFGDPTELAMLDFVEKQGQSVHGLRERHGRLDEAPFSSSRKLMSTLHEIAGQRRMLVKGAPDVLLGRCRYHEKDGKVVWLEKEHTDAVTRELNGMAAGALRVLGFAWKDVGQSKGIDESDENDLVFVGLMGMIDPPRPEVKLALEEAKSAGISTIMITGDNLLTAKAIAGELGLLEEGDEVISGQQLEEISDEELARRVRKIRVFARVWPEQKLRIVQALQANHEVVAMTGDGVNDAPAIKKADIGVSMGITGTDVAKETADVVLADDNFATIVHAIEQGRVIFENIRKFVMYLLSCNLGEILVVFFPILLGFGSPLSAVQLLLINLVTDALPALALGVDAAEPGIMRRRPRGSKEGIVTGYYMKLVLFNAVFIGAAVIASFLIGLKTTGNLAVAETMALVTLCFDELLRAYSFRSETRSFWQIDPRTNPRLLGAIFLSGLVAVSVVVVPPLRTLFGTDWLDASHWLIALGLSLIPVIAYETWKIVRRRMEARQS